MLKIPIRHCGLFVNTQHVNIMTSNGKNDYAIQQKQLNRVGNYNLWVASKITLNRKTWQKIKPSKLLKLQNITKP